MPDDRMFAQLMAESRHIPKDTPPPAAPSNRKVLHLSVNLPEDQQKAIYERWDAFRKALDDGKDAEIVLNSDEINTLIDRESELKGKVYAKMFSDGLVKCKPPLQPPSHA